MSGSSFMRGVSAGAMAIAFVSTQASAQQTLPSIDVGAAPRGRPQSARPAASAAPARPAPTRPIAPAPVIVAAPPGFSAERMKLPVYRDPPGQTVTSVDTKRFENESLATVGDLVQYSPGVQVYQGNSARDMNISIRGSGARSSTGLSNIVVLEDGFSMTPVNGGGTNIATTLGMAPQAYGGVDVYRGGSSALFGNYAMSGAVNFRMRSGAQIDGFETGHEYGSFGSVQNWLVAGKKYKDFDISLFASDARSDG